MAIKSPISGRARPTIPTVRGYNLAKLEQIIDANTGDSLLDTDFTNAGIMTTNGVGVYSYTADNSTNWDTAYTTSNTTAALVQTGTGTPEAVVTAPVGTLFLRTDGGASTTLYVKESGSGNTGWVAK